MNRCAICCLIFAILVGLFIVFLPSLVVLHAKSSATSGFAFVLQADRSQVASFLPDTLELAPLDALPNDLQIQGKHPITVILMQLVRECPDTGSFPPPFEFTYYEMIFAVPFVRYRNEANQKDGPFPDQSDYFYNVAMYVNISGPALTGSILGFPKLYSEDMDWTSKVDLTSSVRHDSFYVVYPRGSKQVPVRGELTFPRDASITSTTSTSSPASSSSNLKCVQSSDYQSILIPTFNQTWVTPAPFGGLVVYTAFDYDLWNPKAFQMCPVAAKLTLEFADSDKHSSLLKVINGEHLVPALGPSQPTGAFYFHGKWTSYGPLQYIH